MNKLGYKRMGPKAKKELREYNWLRIMGHNEEIVVVDPETGEKLKVLNHCAGIMGMKRPTQCDLWWARKFLRCILADPIVVVKPERGDKPAEIRDEGLIAQSFLNEFDRKWPEPKEKKKRVVSLPKNGQVKLTSTIRRKECRRKLNKIYAAIRETKSKLEWHEKRYSNLAVSNPKWKEVKEKVDELKGNLKRFEVERDGLKAKL